MRTRVARQLLTLTPILLALGTAPAAGAVSVLSEEKISDSAGGFGGLLDDSDELGTALAGLGDLDGDGIEDLAVGAPGDDDGSGQAGAVWILFLAGDGSVQSEQKISSSAGGFGGVLANGDRFGRSLAALGDLDGDGVGDLAVGAYLTDLGGSGRGCVWILFLNADGTVKSEQQIGHATGGFGGSLDDVDQFGVSLALLGDVDGDGIQDLGVSAERDDDGGTDRGAVWVLFLERDGTVREQQKISATQGGFTGVLDDDDHFGTGVAGLGDFDGDGAPDLAVGADSDDDGGSGRGAVWLLFLEPDGSVKAHQKISSSSGGFSGTLADQDHFGRSIAALGDLDGDALQDVAVGAYLDDDGGLGAGAVWLLSLDSDGSVKSEQKISATAGGFSGALDAFDEFGYSVAAVGDLDGDTVQELAVGAYFDDDGGLNRGAVWALRLDAVADACGNGVLAPVLEECDDGAALAGDGCSALCQIEDSITLYGLAEGGGAEVTIDGVNVVTPTSAGQMPAQVLAALAALVNSHPGLMSLGTTALVLGAELVTTGLVNAAATSDPGMTFAPGTAQGQQKISDTEGGFGGGLADLDRFGESASALGDLDGDGITELAVGATGLAEQSVWILFLASDGTVGAEQEISATAGGFTGDVAADDFFGAALAGLGDLDGDGIADLAVGAYGDDDGGNARGAVWILFLDADGSVKGHQKISATQGGFSGVLDDVDTFGRSLAAPGDVDGDGVPDLAVGATGDDDGGSTRGAVWILFLSRDGTVKGHQKISATQGGFSGLLSDLDRFGHSLAGLGDLDGNGVPDLAVGQVDGIGPDTLWTLRLEADGTVLSHVEIRDGLGGFSGAISGARFAQSLANLGDLDADGVTELAVGADADGDRGAVWMLFLEPDGGVRASRKVGDATGGFAGALDDFDHFGHSLAGLGDLDGDGAQDLAVGAERDDDGGGDRGAVWIAFLDAVPFACGNGVRDPVEECDDGDALAGDGCNALCELEDTFALFGVAEGGSVGITVDGVALAVPTLAGQSAAEVLAALAAAVGADPVLMAQGTTAFVQGNALVTNGIVTGASIADDGLGAMAAPPVPATPAWGPMALAAALLLAAASAVRRARG